MIYCCRTKTTPRPASASVPCFETSGLIIQCHLGPTGHLHVDLLYSRVKCPGAQLEPNFHLLVMHAQHREAYYQRIPVRRPAGDKPGVQNNVVNRQMMPDAFS